MTLSIVILTKNESNNISKCLSSVAWADEVIIIDDLSTDETISIAKKAVPSVQIFTRALNDDFAGQHNFGLEKASGDWVLFIDADEIVPPALHEEIVKVLLNVSPDVEGFYLKRQDTFLNTKLAHGETSNWKSIRLGRSGAGKWRREVHEYWDITTKTLELHNPLEHKSHDSVSALIKTLNFYTTIDAKHMFEVDKKHFELFRVFANPLGKFIQNYLLRCGFLDGFAGFVMAFMMSFNSLLVRVKIYDLEIQNSNLTAEKK